jgi:putative CocE/NonD family hydrolase
MRDGCRLAARIWLPSDADKHPVPAILEYIPYRKNDGTAVSDALRHPYFAGFGYASLRVDLRGCGDSDGVILDEYLIQEQDDALDVLAWLEQQPWCTGRVGMMGYSWGGFNSLQVAARKPKQLKAIVTVHSTDDRYGGDCHYAGGCLLACDMLSWATTAFAYNSRPPDPGVVGRRWRAQWRERLEGSKPYIDTWLSHQIRDDYWKHGSVCEDYSAIECAVLTVGGWADPYHDTVFRLLEHLRAPRRGIIGPWAHLYPDEALPGPQIGFNQECLRWWDQWLKDIDTGIMDEPLLRAYILDSEEPASFYAERRGSWAAETQWPPTSAPTTFFIGSRSLKPAQPAVKSLTLISTEAAGMSCGQWCPGGKPGSLPADQRCDDALSLVFDSQPLDAPLEVLGFPLAELVVSADKALASLVVRLCDVSPTGSSTLVARAVLNLAHRESGSRPSPLEPNSSYHVRVPLSSVGYRFAKEHRIRLAIAPSYWPWVWPAPESVALTVMTGISNLELPRRKSPSADAPAFHRAELAPPLDVETLKPTEGRWRVTRDLVEGRVELVVKPDGLGGLMRLCESGLVIGEDCTNTYSIVDGDPLSASVRCERTMEVGGSNWNTTIEIESSLTCDAQDYFVRTSLRASDSGKTVFERVWSSAIPRVMG